MTDINIINIAMIGSVSSGKSTSTNSLFACSHSDINIKRTSAKFKQNANLINQIYQKRIS
jgi:hypothetical protein